MSAAPRALLVDLDDTLVDRSGALRRWLRRRADLDPAAITELLTLDAETGSDLAMLSITLLRRRPGLAADPLALGERIRRELPGFLERDDAVLRALTQLRRRGLALALVSNGGGEGQRAKLAAAGIDPSHFAAVLISGELGVAKPTPAIFERALASLGAGADEAIMIGDSSTDDIAGAAAVGLSSCWIRRGRPLPAPTLTPAPTWTADDFPSAAAMVLAGSLNRARSA